MNDNVKKAIVDTLGQAKEEDRYYVYALCEKKNDKCIPFYIGKGQGERIWQHECETEEVMKKLEKELNAEYGSDIVCITSKHKNIQALKKEDKYQPVLVKWGLTEKEAFMAESALINLLKIMPDIDLANIANGHASKKEKDKNQTTRAYKIKDFDYRTPLDISNEETRNKLRDLGVICININKFYGLCLSSGIKDIEDHIKDATRGSWIIGKDKEPKYIFSIYQSKICGIYKIGKKVYHSNINAETIEDFPLFPPRIRTAEKEILKLLLKYGNYEQMTDEIKSRCRKLKAVAEEDKHITYNDIENFEKHEELFKKEISEADFKKWINRAFFICESGTENTEFKKIKEEYLSRIIKDGEKSIFVRRPTRYLFDLNSHIETDEDQDEENYVVDD